MNRRARFLAKAGLWLLGVGVICAAISRVDYWLLLWMWSAAVIFGIFAGFAFKKDTPIWFFSALGGWLIFELILWRLMGPKSFWMTYSAWVAYWIGAIGVLGVALRLEMALPVKFKADDELGLEKEIESE